MLLKHPLLREIITNPVPITEEASRCLSLARQYSTHRHPCSERHLRALEAALQPPLRASPSVVDPALDAKSTEQLSLEIPEMTMLDVSVSEVAMRGALCLW